MIIRFIFAGFLILVGLYLLRGNSSRHVALRRLMFLSFVLIGISILLFSNFWTELSLFLGVGSSTQLLIYLLTFAFIGSTISNYRWRREQEERVIELARQIALLSK